MAEEVAVEDAAKEEVTAEELMESSADCETLNTDPETGEVQDASVPEEVEEALRPSEESF